MKHDASNEELTDFERTLIKRTATAASRRFSLSYAEEEDAIQELSMMLLRHRVRYDSSHPSGSTYESYITRYMQKCSARMLDVIRPNSSFIENTGVEFVDDSLFKSGKQSMDDSVLFRICATDAVAALNEYERDILMRRYNGDSTEKIIRDTGISKFHVMKLLQSIRQTFELCGFHPTTQSGKDMDIS